MLKNILTVEFGREAWRMMFFVYKYSYFATILSLSGALLFALGIRFIFCDYSMGIFILLIGITLFGISLIFGKRMDKRALMKKIQFDLTFCKLFALEHPEFKELCIELNHEYAVACINGTTVPNGDKEYQKLLKRIEKRSIPK